MSGTLENLLKTSSVSHHFDSALAIAFSLPPRPGITNRLEAPNRICQQPAGGDQFRLQTNARSVVSGHKMLSVLPELPFGLTDGSDVFQRPERVLAAVQGSLDTRELVRKWKVRGMRILLVDSDVEELEITAFALRRQGFQVSIAVDGKSAIAKWRSEYPALVILDAALAKINGLEVCRQIREQSESPVIFISERSGDQDVVAAFNVGADDYVVKPFSIKQLVARIRAVLRRAGDSRSKEERLDGILNVGNLLIDTGEHKVTLGGQRVHMTPLEFRLLHCLAANKGRVVSADQLIDHAWGLRDGADGGVLKTHISRIRQKLSSTMPNGGYIRNIPGIGYSLEV